jgi:hypothetical protein
MFNRMCFGALLLTGLAVSLTGCSTSGGLDSIQVTPASASLVVGGATLQLTATGTFGNGAHPTTQNITNTVTWSSAISGVASVNSSGVVTGLSAGTTTIAASAPGYNGPLSASTTITVSGGGSGTGTSGIVSLAIIPVTQSVAAPGDTSQFIAIGTTSSGSTLNLTGVSTWSSSSTTIATVGSPEKVGTVPGLASAMSKGTVTITALYTNPASQTVVAGTAEFTITSGGGSLAVTSLSITPNSESLSASGQSGQLIALATYGSSGLVEDVTNSSQLAWSSNIPSVATISTNNAPTQTCAYNNATPAVLVCTNDSPGLAKGVNTGSATITAEWTNPANGSTPANVVYGTASVTVTNSPPPQPIISLTIIPSSLTVENLQGSGQFLAIGTFSTPPYVRDLTDSVTWISSFPNIFPVDTNSGGNTGASAGIVTAYGNGSATIIAEASSGGTNPSIQTATATFSCPLILPCPCTVEQGCTPAITTCGTAGPTAGSCYPTSEASSLLSTVTVYNEGVNNTNWLVTAPSATGTPNVIHCGPGWAIEGNTGGSVCVGTYPISVSPPIIITATQTPGSTGTFGGWSSNCTPVVGPTNLTPTTISANGPNYCALAPTTFNETVGAIFN